MKLIKIILVNLFNYGFLEYIKMSFYELVYLSKSEYRKHFFHDESITTNYEKINFKNQSLIFDGPYHPTPIYHLKLIEKVLKKIDLKSFTFIDFGCGAGRVTFFFRKMFKKIIGIDINQNYKKFFNEKIFFLKDIRKIQSLDDLSIIKDENNFVLFFFRPIEDDSLFRIIEVFRKKKIYIVTINVKKNNSEKFYLVYEKYFAEPSRNIIIYSNFRSTK